MPRFLPAHPFSKAHRRLFTVTIAVFVASVAAIAALFSITPTHSQTAGGVIGVRIFENTSNQSAAEWYADRCRGGTFAQCGTPEPVVVDGYNGIRDGNSVYVNVANVKASEIYTNIYLFSIAQNAGPEEQEVFDRLLAHVRFNTNVFPIANRAALRRDTLRREHIVFLENAIARYKKPRASYCRADVTRSCDNTQACQTGTAADECVQTGRCSITQNQACTFTATRNNECPVGETCGHFVPPLRAGTFVPGTTYSTWPSWQQELGRALGATLPTDPVNTFSGCSAPYDVRTCWDGQARAMQCFAEDSLVYAYGASANAGDAAPTIATLATRYEYAGTGSATWRNRDEHRAMAVFREEDPRRPSSCTAP